MLHEAERVAHAARRSAWTAALYADSARRLLRPRLPRARAEQRLVLVVGSPRSGTTFLARSLGSQSGFVDLGEVKPVKAAIPRLAHLEDAEAAQRFRQTLERVRLLGLVRGLRGVEQTPETAFVLRPALLAYPQARAVHLVRDGRDVVCSLLERGWLSAARAGRDDAGLTYGAHARFWVEADRAAAFAAASDARRAAWAWRRYASAARVADERVLELRYEDLVSDPTAAARRLAAHLDSDSAPLAAALSEAHDESIGRWRRELTPEQREDVEREAGVLLRELGYST